jgi:hypothetical protein
VHCTVMSGLALAGMQELGSWVDLYSGLCVTLGCVAAATSCALWGKLICGPAVALELAAVAGWGVLCLIGTLVGYLAPEAHGVRLTVDVWIGGGATLLALCVLSWARRDRLARLFGPAWFPTGDAIFIWRVGVVALPLLVAVWGIGPGLVDSYTHWIPNLMYLADLGTFPRSPGEAPLSRFPAFPYGLQILAYAATRVGGRFGGNPADPTALMRMSLLLQLAAAAMLARTLFAAWFFRGERGSHPPKANTIPGWLAALLGFLLVIPLNPFFYPKVQLSPYGDAATSVALAACVIAAHYALKGGGSAAWSCLAMAATALVATKQANFALAGCVFVAASMWSLRTKVWATTWGRLAAAAVPCVLTYVVWRLYVDAHLPAAENKVMAFSDWHVQATGVILHSMLVRLVKSPPELLLLSLALLVAVREWRRPASAESGLAAMMAIVTATYELFLFSAYVMVFGGEHAAAALSFERFNSHLSVGLLLVLAPYLARACAGVEGRVTARGALLATSSLSIIAGVAMIFLARYDLTSGIADAADIARAIVARGVPDRAVAIATPNGGLAFEAIRMDVVSAGSDFRSTRFINLSDMATSLNDILASGAGYAVVSCGLARAITGQSGPALLERDGEGWKSVVTPPPHHRVFNVRTARSRSIFLACSGTGA